jgi:hydrogenase nickel incorporation protein HypB
MSSIKVAVVEKIMSANDRMADMNRALLDSHKVFSINIMASPGAGKTSFILQTIKTLSNELKLGVIEGDTAPVTIDADKIIKAGMPAIQINTGGDCHLEASMFSDGLQQMPLNDLDILIVENVGNLICPAAWYLGTHINLLIASVPEGDDKPYKYPNIYRGLDVLIINKTDLMPYVEYNLEYFRKGVEMLNPGLTTFPVSCRTGEGFDAWIAWLKESVKQYKQGK